jgi:hypothetical protein
MSVKRQDLVKTEPDKLLAACKAAGVTTRYSEGMASRTDYDGLTIVQPFV